MTASAVRAVERAACASGDLSTATLMERAGAAAYAQLRAAFPAARRLAVVCGKGNNGGDGYVLARLAHGEGLSVDILQVGQPGGGDAALALGRLHKAGLALKPFAPTLLSGADVIVDGLLGTGFSGALSDVFAEAVNAINASGLPVVALDLPSGLLADSGAAPGPAVLASLTVCFVAFKRGLFTGQGPALCGRRLLADLALTAFCQSALAEEREAVELLDFSPLPPRRRSAHKGHFGHVLALGGDEGMAGAIRLAGEACLRVGAGLVSVGTRPPHAQQIPLARAELMAHGIAGGDDPALAALLNKASVVLVGPGLGRSAWSRGVLNAALASGLPMVLDADALNALADLQIRPAHAILTPHPGEAARLLRCSVADIEADRFGAVRALARRYAAVVVLKGAGSLIADPGGAIGVCTAGNPGMASGGMGDVLTGVIAGLLAQGLSPLEAAQRGVVLHAEAGDRAAAEGGERGLLASDLLPWLRRGVNGVK